MNGVGGVNSVDGVSGVGGVNGGGGVSDTGGESERVAWVAFALLSCGCVAACQASSVFSLAVGCQASHLRFACSRPLPRFHLIICVFLIGLSVLFVHRGCCASCVDTDGKHRPSSRDCLFPSLRPSSLTAFRSQWRRTHACATALCLLAPVKRPDVMNTSVFLVKRFSVSFFRLSV